MKHSLKIEKGRQLISFQCHEDIHSCIVGFIELCKLALSQSKQIYITPGLINSDVVENIFNQHKSTYTRANSSSNALKYSRTLNSIALGQNTVSAKGNAGRSRNAAIPYDFSLKRVQAKLQN